MLIAAGAAIKPHFAESMAFNGENIDQGLRNLIWIQPPTLV